jgi:hypothetical protein
MNRTLRLAPLAAGLALAPTFAGASIPSNLDGRAREGLLHVCADVEPGDSKYQVCTEQVDSMDPESAYTGSECAGVGLPAACTIDFVPKLRLKGRLLLMLDEAAFDSFGGSRIESGVVLELKVRKKKQTLIELFDGSEVGFWNAFDESFLVDVLQDVAFKTSDDSAYNFTEPGLLADNLTDLGLRIRALAQDAYPKIDLSEAVPVLTSVVREKKAPTDGSGDDLASGARFKIVVEFARARP